MAGVAAYNRRILVLDGDEARRSRVAGILSQAGYQLTPVSEPAEALRCLAERHYDAAIVDAEGPAAEVQEWIRGIRRRFPGTPVLLLVDPTRLAEAVQALRQGAADYLLRPPDPFDLKTRLGRILDRTDLDSRITLLQEEIAKKSVFRNPIGQSAAMQGVLERLMRVAPMRATVLVLGESGVGKELVARAIHFNSRRRDRPFIALNCAAMPANLIESELFGHERGSFTGAHARSRGKFELAHRGTLFLDEISEMELATQAKLLRVLEEREFMRVGGDESVRVDVRLIAATNADLEDLVSRNLFRRDLYYRLKVVTIHVPPLRERRADIPLLVDTFLDELSRSNAVPRKSITPEAMEALARYGWPGNVRELKNVLESVLVSCRSDLIRPEDLPPSISRARSEPPSDAIAAGTTLAEMERVLIRKTLEHTGGNRTHAAELLGIGVRTLQRKIRAFGLEIRSQRRRPRRRRAPAETAPRD